MKTLHLIPRCFIFYVMPRKGSVAKKTKSSSTRPKKRRVRIRTNKATIKVVGIGGGGGNAVSRMKESFVRGVEFIALNTDIQDLDYCDAHKKLAIGKNVTRGLGTGMDPDLGKRSAEENKTEIADLLSGADLVFVTAGLGGGTGSGASAIVAETARELGALTVAVVTKPFSFEGGQRSKIAEEAMKGLRENVDAFIVIPNDRIFSIIGKDTSINKAFEKIDEILRGAVEGIAELIAMTGLINVDFADVKAIMRGTGSALVGIGTGSGKERGISAIRQVLNSPLLDTAIDGARGILFGISGGRDLKMIEINEIAKMITENVDPEARVIFGAYHSRKVERGSIKITLIATGFGAEGLSNQRTFNSDGAEDKFEAKTNPLFELGSKKQELENGQSVRHSRSPVANSGKTDKSDKASRSDGIDKIEKINKVNKLDRGEMSESGKFDKSKNSKKPTEIWDIPAFLRRKK